MTLINNVENKIVEINDQILILIDEELTIIIC